MMTFIVIQWQSFRDFRPRQKYISHVLMSIALLAEFTGTQHALLVGTLWTESFVFLYPSGPFPSYILQYPEHKSRVDICI